MSKNREFKGKSIIAFPTDYVAIDLETTGLSPDFDEIIEIACIRIRNGIEVDSFQRLVRPDDLSLVDSYITALTGISQSMLTDAPHISTVLPEALEFIGQDIVIGHNVSFDVNFLYDNAVRLGIGYFSNNYIDTMRLSRRLFPNFKNHKLKTLVREFKIADTIAHRAEADARQTSLCFIYLSNYITSNNLLAEFPPKFHSSSIRSKDIIGNPELYRKDSPLFDKTVVFTGTLERLSRKEAMQLVANLGGKNGDSITKKTNYLVLGNNDLCSTIKDGKSTKQKKAEQYILAGADLIIISESAFYDMLYETPEIVDINHRPSFSVPSHGFSSQSVIPHIGLDLSVYEISFVDRISSILSVSPHFDSLHIEQRSGNYLSILAGNNDFIRFKYSQSAKWISLDLPRDISVANLDNPIFDAQKNKAQRHWKAKLSSLDDLNAMSDLICASCIVR